MRRLSLFSAFLLLICNGVWAQNYVSWGDHKWQTQIFEYFCQCDI